MPTYEYECTVCGHQFEEYQSITAAPLKRCPKCRKKVRRLLGTGSGLLFKGSGFYTTDYRSSGYKASAKNEKTEGGKTESGKTEGKSSPETSGSSAAKAGGANAKTKQDKP